MAALFRRGFSPKERARTEECRFVLESFGDVYGYDAQGEGQGLQPEERLRLHQKHSLPAMNALHAWSESQFAEKKVEPNSGSPHLIDDLQSIEWLKQTGTRLHDQQTD